MSRERELVALARKYHLAAVRMIELDVMLLGSSNVTRRCEEALVAFYLEARELPRPQPWKTNRRRFTR